MAIPRAIMLPVCLVAVAWSQLNNSARGQLIGLTDEIIAVAKGASKKESNRRVSALGNAPGARENPFAGTPEGRASSVAGTVDPARSTVRYRGGQRSALAAISAPGPQLTRSASPLAAAQPDLREREPIPIYGPLELPQGDEEGPRDGLTLDAAIERLVRANLDLRSKYYEVPQARADVLTAGLRGNPFYFASASNYPYKAYSPSRPGGVDCSVSVVQPVDINHKRQARAQAAAAAVKVLEAQYQNAVRLAIADLYNSFLQVVIARETVRYSEASLAGAERLMQAAQLQFEKRSITRPEMLNVSIQRNAARLGLRQAQVQFKAAKHELAVLLNLSEDTPGLDVRGAIRDLAPPPPGADALVSTALSVRPDLAAFRLGINRARADVRVARKEVVEDIFVIYSPYQAQNNQAIGAQNTTSFSFGLLGTIPLFNRNQGEIRRARYNVSQTQVALAALEREIAHEVRHAYMEYEASREAVDEMTRDIVPASAQVRDGVYQQYRSGEKSLLDFLSAQKDHNEIVRQYRDAVIRHRRGMLDLNTTVGRRILP